MTEQEKRRLYIVGGIIIAVLLLLFFGRKAIEAGNTIIQQGEGIVLPNHSIPGYSFGDIGMSSLPSLNSPRVSSRGCAVCFDGYNRIVPPTTPAPAPAPLYNPEPIIRYIDRPPIYQPQPQPRGYSVATYSPTRFEPAPSYDPIPSFTGSYVPSFTGNYVPMLGGGWP